MENPIKMDDLGVFPLFLEGHPYISTGSIWTPKISSSTPWRAHWASGDDSTASWVDLWSSLHGSQHQQEKKASEFASELHVQLGLMFFFWGPPQKSKKSESGRLFDTIQIFNIFLPVYFVYLWGQAVADLILLPFLHVIPEKPSTRKGESRPPNKNQSSIFQILNFVKAIYCYMLHVRNPSIGILYVPRG